MAQHESAWLTTPGTNADVGVGVGVARSLCVQSCQQPDMDYQPAAHVLIGTFQEYTKYVRDFIAFTQAPAKLKELLKRELFALQIYLECYDSVTFYGRADSILRLWMEDAIDSLIKLSRRIRRKFLPNRPRLFILDGPRTTPPRQ